MIPQIELPPSPDLRPLEKTLYERSVKLTELLTEAHGVMHNVVGMISDKDDAHGKITDLMRRIREIL